jgi:hypothetical protein
MTLKTKLTLRLLWVPFGILAVTGGIYMTVCGFSGVLSAFFAGMGWLLSTLNILAHVIGDMGKAAQAALDLADRK